MLGLATAGPAPANPPSLAAVAERLGSDEADERFAAHELLLEQIRRFGAEELGAAERQAVLDVVPGLMTVARRTERIYPMGAAPLLAIELLGELRAAEAIPLLLDRIDDDFPRILVNATDVSPAAKALVRIGAGAIEPILDRTAAADESEWRMLTATLRAIEPREPVVSAVERHLSAGDPLELVVERWRELRATLLPRRIHKTRS